MIQFFLLTPKAETAPENCSDCNDWWLLWKAKGDSKHID